MLKEKDKKQNKNNRQAIAFTESAEYAEIAEEENEIAVATMVLNKPYVCPSLKPARVRDVPKFKTKETNNYSFDIYKLDEIFDLLLKDGMIKLFEGQVISSKEEIADKKYCKWHHSTTHDTVNCIVFRKTIQEAIRQGKIKFAEDKGKGLMEVGLSQKQSAWLIYERRQMMTTNNAVRAVTRS